MRKSIRTMETPTRNASAPTHLSDEFPAGYSLTRCSPAELDSASPAGVEHVSELGQVWGSSNTEDVHSQTTNPQPGSKRHKIGLFFCPDDGVHLIQPNIERCAGNLKLQRNN